MIRDISSIHLCNIAIKLMAITKITEVSTLSIAVPLTREDTLPSGRLKGHTQATDSGEEIHKLEIPCYRLSIKRQH